MTKRINLANLIIFICLYVCMYFIIKKKTYMLLLIICVCIIFLVLNKVNKFEIIILIPLTLLFLFLLIFVPNQYNQYYVVRKLENNTNFFYLRDQFFKFLDNHYNQNKTVGFIKYFIFNKKTKLVNELFKDLKDIGILQLLTISGFHINIFLKIFNLIFKKLNHKKAKIASNLSGLIFVLGYGYFLSYSISILRIMFTLIFNFFFNHKLSAVLSCYLNTFIFVNIVGNFGFLLSYGCVLIIYAVSSLNLKWIYQYLLINILCFMYTIFFQLEMNEKINLLACLYSIFFSFIVTILYLWFLFSALIFPIQIVNDWLVNTIFVVASYLANSILFIKYYKEVRYIIPIYYLMFICFLNFNLKENYDCCIKRWNYQI